MGGARRLEVQGAVGNLSANLAERSCGIFRNVSKSQTSERARYFLADIQREHRSVGAVVWSPHNELALSLFSHRRSAPGIYIDRGYGTASLHARGNG